MSKELQAFRKICRNLNSYEFTDEYKKNKKLIETTLKNYEELTSKPVILCGRTHGYTQALIDTICKNYKEVKITNLEDEKKAQNEITQNKDLKDNKNKQLRRAILLPIHPNYLLYILKGKKTLEIRNTCPKEWLEYLHSDGERPEDIDVYLYCTKKTPEMAIEGIPANGRVVAKFTLRKIWAYINGARWKDGKPGKHDDYLLDAICTRACLKEDDLWAYSPDLAFYAWFVEDVELLEKPLELSHFGVDVAPQTWRYINL